MENILLVIHVVITIILIGMVLIQRSDSDGFGLGSGSGSNLLSGRSAANAMTRLTAILAAVFIVNSLILSVMASRHHRASIVDVIEQEQQAEVKKLPEVPNSGENKSSKSDNPAVKPKPDVAPAKSVKAVPNEASAETMPETVVPAPAPKPRRKKPKPVEEIPVEEE